MTAKEMQEQWLKNNKVKKVEDDKRTIIRDCIDCGKEIELKDTPNSNSIFWKPSSKAVLAKVNKQNG